MISFYRRPGVWLCSLLLLGATATALAGAQTGDPARARTGVEANKPAAPAMQHGRGPKKLALSNAEGALVTLWKPDLSRRELVPKMGMVSIPPTGVDNYHAVVVERDWGNVREAIVRYEYLRGKPSGESPGKLAAAVKTPLEIVPDPIPREHHRYYARAEAGFIVRYQDRVLPGHTVELTTSNGTSLHGVSDGDGRVVLRIPDDFPDIVPGERDRRSAELSIATEYQTGGVRYQSALTAAYRVSPEHWQSQGWGLAVAGVGFAFGGLLSGRLTRDRKGGAK
ncbi:hypothetical protein [Sedimenticola hydrogenitrophicus]|uniref:hypothetical protein n=1 Tax=Sedimenticola hydrogenitrophicus TaxID=2967975 RepID=UPI0023B0C166|nr:hypothetical protein [Sedimenticola hydrogenitrophicus]